MTYKKDQYTPEEGAKILARDRERYKQQPEYAEKRKAYSRAYNKTPKGRERQKNRRYDDERKNKITDWARKRQYGLTPEGFAMLLVIQDGKCAVCLVPFTLEGKKRRFLHVDHCHGSKQVRGLLCAHCNVAEGYIRKLGITPREYAKRLQAYLDSPPAQQEVIW